MYHKVMPSGRVQPVAPRREPEREPDPSQLDEEGQELLRRAAERRAAERRAAERRKARAPALQMPQTEKMKLLEENWSTGRKGEKFSYGSLQNIETIQQEESISLR
jgi:hypothetical protein